MMIDDANLDLDPTGAVMHLQTNIPPRSQDVGRAKKKLPTALEVDIPVGYVAEDGRSYLDLCAVSIQGMEIEEAESLALIGPFDYEPPTLLKEYVQWRGRLWHAHQGGYATRMGGTRKALIDQSQTFKDAIATVPPGGALNYDQIWHWPHRLYWKLFTCPSSPFERDGSMHRALPEHTEDCRARREAFDDCRAAAERMAMGERRLWTWSAGLGATMNGPWPFVPRTLIPRYQTWDLFSPYEWGTYVELCELDRLVDLARSCGASWHPWYAKELMARSRIDESLMRNDLLRSHGAEVQVFDLIHLAHRHWETIPDAIAEAATQLSVQLLLRPGIVRRPNGALTHRSNQVDFGDADVLEAGTRTMEDHFLPRKHQDLAELEVLKRVRIHAAARDMLLGRIAPPARRRLRRLL